METINLNFEVIEIERDTTKTTEENFQEYFEKEHNKRIHRIHCSYYIPRNGIDIKKGVPDFVYFDDKKIKYIEVKSMNDGLRYCQIKWMLEHAGDDIKTTFIKWKIPSEKKKIKKRDDVKYCLELITLLFKEKSEWSFAEIRERMQKSDASYNEIKYRIAWNRLQHESKIIAITHAQWQDLDNSTLEKIFDEQKYKFLM